MVTNEELLSQIEQKKQEIIMVQNELQNRMQSRQMAQPETITQKVFRVFNNFSSPRRRPQDIGQGINSYNMSTRVGQSPSTNEARDDEVNYFRKLLHKRDIEIRKQKHMITKMNAPEVYIKKDFLKNNISLNKRQPSEAWLR